MMKFRKWFVLLGFLVLIGVSAAQISCNAESAALSLFTKQGLNLLRPARDYIQPGGMVFVAKSGNPEYDDPKDAVSPEKGNLTDFRASILKETVNKTTGFGVALTLAASVVPMSISAGAQSNRVVSLKGIDTTGVRLTTNDLDSLIARPNTSKAAATDLRRGIRVFVVQEIYKATSLDLHAADSKSFDLKYDNGTAVANCKQTAQPSDTKSDSGASQPGKTDSTQPANATSGSSGATQQTGKTTGAAKAKGQTAPKSSTAQPSATSKLAAGVAVCVGDDFTLKLSTKEPIPFAVRLAELELSGGTVQRRRGGKVFQGTLGGGEISGALLNDKTPVIARLTRRSSAPQ